MSDEFNWILEKYQKRAASVLDGIVVQKVTWPFSTKVMDASFDYSTQLIDGIKEYLSGEYGLVPKQVVIFTALQTNLERTAHSMKTESSLYVVKDKNGDVNVLFFTGCIIDDAKAQ